jgi:hypothetical protein
MIIMQLEGISQTGWTKYAVGYREAVRIIIQAIRNSKSGFETDLILPLIFLSGHSIELMLKKIIQERGKNLDYIHPLTNLFEKVEYDVRTIARLPLGELSHKIDNESIDRTKQFISDLDEIYPIVVRYPTFRNNKPTIKDGLQLDINNFDDQFNESFSILVNILLLHWSSLEC